MKVNIYGFNGIFDDLADAILERNEAVEGQAIADVIVLWNDVVGAGMQIAMDSKFENKRVIVGEHGLLSINDYIPPLSRPLIADTFMAWGKVTKKWLVKKAKISPKRIKITGTTIFSKMGKKEPQERKHVLYNPRHWVPDIQENLDVAESLKKYKKAFVYSKIIHGEHDPKKYPNPIESTRHLRGHLEACYDTLKKADVVVGIGEGTFAALAYYMDIPYISVDNWKSKELLGKVYTREIFNEQISYACKQVKLKDLHDAIDEELKKPDNMKEERERFKKEYLDGADPKKALKKQLKVIYEN